MSQVKLLVQLVKLKMALVEITCNIQASKLSPVKR